MNTNPNNKHAPSIAGDHHSEKCSVIIPTYRRTSSLHKALESLSLQTERDFEVIVVVDGEDPEARSFASTFKAPYRLRWIFEQENKGLPSARNAGAMAAESDILLFLDDDMVPAADWLHHHLKHHRSDNRQCETGIYGRVVNKYMRPPGSRTERHMRESRDRDLAMFEALVRNQSLAFGKMVAFGVNTSIRRQTFLAVGGYDPYLNFIDEDADFGSRLYNRGLQFILEPNAIVYHQDSKNGMEYRDAILSRSGRYDAYRRREKRQINGRIPLLSQFYCGSFWRRLAHRIAWYFPWVFRLADSFCKWVTDTTGSKLSYHLWYKTGVGMYWKGVREAGETFASLRDLYPPPAPILMLHSISKPAKRNLKLFHLSPQRLSQFIGRLKKSGYTSVLPTEWQAHTAASRRVILTFDDGYEDFMNGAFPVLDRMGFKATVFVVVDRIGKTNDWDESGSLRSRQLLSRDQIRELHRHGVHFGSHTLTHARLTSLSDHDLEREVSDSKHKLEDLLGSEVSCFSYPWGAANMRVRGAVARAGYKVAVTTEEGLNRLQDPLSLKRINLGEVDTLPEFLLKLATGKDARQRLKWFLIEKRLYQDGYIHARP